MIETFKAGGLMMWPLLASALAGVAIIFERFIVLSRVPSTKEADKQLSNVEEALTSGGLEGCAKVVSRGKGILNYIFARLLKRFDTLMIEKRDLERARGIEKGKGQQDPIALYLTREAEIAEFKNELSLTIDDASRSYVSRFLAALNTVSSVSPLLGLLGTITGMIRAFDSIAAAGTGDPKVVAGGIAEALITTAAGLFIAIPAVVFYKYLGVKADKARSAVEMHSVAFANTLIAYLARE